MPRSFLVKQPKVHDFSSSNYYHQHQQHWDDSYSVTHAITESATNLAVRLSENGYIHDYIIPSVLQSTKEPGHEQTGLSSGPLYSPGGSVGEEFSDHDMEHPDSPVSSSTIESDSSGPELEACTIDAFLISDGRSRRRSNQRCPRKGGSQSDSSEDVGSADCSPAKGKSKGRHVCGECGKSYATSSNLSRHKQTHRSLDSQQARKCPTCHKAKQPEMQPSEDDLAQSKCENQNETSQYLCQCSAYPDQQRGQPYKHHHQNLTSPVLGHKED
ncbi:Transcriptional repressor scratch 2 [Larimichthys crocea]|uniref:Uncharacterized protein n=1 Tax=Larimichthys crocea TaxID=215358 RepID=A0ACD3RHV6_LARCR|nr:Transcriptional repressor scratch 2 [Larimichthys crocea]